MNTQLPTAIKSSAPQRTPASPGLARKCACGGTPGPSGECEACRRKRLAGQQKGLQAKLAISQPGDIWEQEADRLAEAVISKPAPKPGRQPGVMRKAAATPAPTEAPGSVQQALRSGGQPLDGTTRDFMETRFGHDFSGVRVHTDRRSAESARQVNALAYTVGQEVVFDTGQYAPHTSAGQKLLAHELAHTLQQVPALPVLRRQVTPFSVNGLYENRADPGEANFVYFDLDGPTPADIPPESVLDPGEETKISNKAHEAVAANDQAITLYGNASEEGGPAHNNPLIERRLDAVEHVLNREGFNAPRVVHRNSNLACSTGKYDYRFWRMVEMQRGTGASTRPCTQSTVQPTTCSTTQDSALQAVRGRALQFITGPIGALARLDQYIQNQASEPAVAAALDRYFGSSHTVQTATDVRARVDAVRAVLQGLAPGGTGHFLCGTLDEPTCHTGSPANAAHNSGNMNICPSFFDNPDYVALQEEILIHESSHASSFATDDRAYQEERIIQILPTRHALANAQSITDFILELNGRARTLGPEHADTVSNCDPQGGSQHETLVREALAWAQRWNTWAMFGTAQTYADPARTASMSPYIDAHFGRSDRAAIAGLYDRYHAMDGWFSLFYNVNCLQTSDPSCSGGRLVSWDLTHATSPAGGGPLLPPATAAAASQTASGTGNTLASQTSTTGSTGPTGSVPAQGGAASSASASPAGSISICPGFFSLGTLYDRVVEMHSGLAVHMPGVSEGLSRSYGRLAYNYKTEYWGVR